MPINPDDIYASVVGAAPNPDDIYRAVVPPPPLRPDYEGPRLQGLARDSGYSPATGIPQIEDFADAYRNWVGGVEAALAESRRAHEGSRDADRPITSTVGGMIIQQPTEWENAAAKDLYRSTVGGPAGNIMITPGVPGPVRAAAGAVYAPILLEDLKTEYQKELGSQAPTDFFGRVAAHGDAAMTAGKNVLVKPIEERVNQFIADPATYTQEVIDKPTLLWDKFFLPFAVGEGAFKSAKGAAKYTVEKTAGRMKAGENAGIDYRTKHPPDPIESMIRESDLVTTDPVTGVVRLKTEAERAAEKAASSQEAGPAQLAPLGRSSVGTTPQVEDDAVWDYRTKHPPDPLENLRRESDLVTTDPVTGVIRLKTDVGRATERAGEKAIDLDMLKQQLGGLRSGTIDNFEVWREKRAARSQAAPVTTAELMEAVDKAIAEPEPVAKSPAKTPDLNAQLQSAWARNDLQAAADILDQMGSPKVAAEVRRQAMQNGAGERLARIEQTEITLSPSFKTSSGKSLMEAHPSELVRRAADDKAVLGVISGKVARAAGIEPGPILLQVGRHDPVTGKGYGLVHIKAREQQIKNLGYQAAEDYVADVLSSYDSIRAGKDDRLLIIKTGRPSGVSVIELRKEHYQGKPFYSVTTAIPKNSRRIKEQSLWPRTEDPLASAPEADTASLGNSRLVGKELPPNVSSHSVSATNIIPIETNVKGNPPDGVRAMAAEAPPVPETETVAKTKPIDVVTRKEILTGINELFTKVWTGRINRKNVLGWFNTRTEAIRLKNYGDLQTVAHEIGHFIDETKVNLANKAFDHELQPLGRQTSGRDYTPEQVRAEGVAEFVREYMTSREGAKQKAPAFYEFFNRELSRHPEVKASLEQITDMVHTWYGQASEARVRGVISYGRSEPWSVERIRKATEAVKDDFYTRFVDELYPLAKLAKQVPEVEGIFKQAWLSRGWAGKAQALIEHGVPEKGIPALQDVIRGVEHDLDGFVNYIVAKHTLDVAAKEMKTAVSVADAEAVVERGQRFEAAQQQLVKYQNHMLDMVVDAGLMTSEAAAELKANWPNYVPFLREFDEAASQKFFATKGFANVRNPIKAMKGSTRDIINPLESIVKNTYQFINLAERNKVGRMFADLAEKPGMGELVEPVTGSGSVKDSVLTVWKNGKRKAYQVDPEIYRALMMLDSKSAEGVLKILQYPAGWLRAGATLTPEFIGRNLTRDAISAAVYSKHGFFPPLDTIRGISHVWKKDALYWEYMQSGAAHAAMVSLDRNYLRNNIRQFMKRTLLDQAKDLPKLPLEILRSFSEASELATRLGEYGKARAHGVSIPEAALGARDITLDFSRAGTFGKKWNRYTAFFNATIQGTDKLIRAHRYNFAQTATKAALYVTLPSVMLYYLNRDDPRYQELPQWQKDLFWIIPTKDYLIRIPKPFELGIIYGTLPERFLQWVDKKDPDAFKDFGEVVAEGVLPNPFPTAMMPVLEWAANYSLFYGRPIVPLREQGLPPKLQAGPYTSDVAKFVGETLNVSPRKVDNTIRGYFGGLGGLATSMVDMASGAADKRPAMRGWEWPGIRGFTATPYKSAQSLTDFQEKYKQQRELANEFKLTGKRPAGYDEVMYNRMQNADKLLKDIHKKERDVLNSKRSAEKKRELLDALNMQAVQISQKALKRQK